MSGLREFQASYARKPQWLTIKNGESKELSFLVEPDDFLYVAEHSSPTNWKKKAVCTYPRCYGCEQQTRQWNPSIRLYIPVHMGSRPYVISQGIGVNSVLHDLVQHKRECGTIRDVVFRVTRTGEGKRAAYKAEPTGQRAPVIKSRINLNSVINTIQYEQQEQYFKE